MIHAVVVDIIWRTSRTAKKETHGTTTVTSMLRRARVEFTRLARLRWRTLQSQQKRHQFDACWATVCDVGLGGALRRRVGSCMPSTITSTMLPRAKLPRVHRRLHEIEDAECIARAGWPRSRLPLVDKFRFTQGRMATTVQRGTPTTPGSSLPSCERASRRLRARKRLCSSASIACTQSHGAR